VVSVSCDLGVVEVGHCTIRARYSVLRFVATRLGRGSGPIPEASITVTVGQFRT
jgi:hypothetical protein